MEDSIFTKIIKNEVHGQVVYEDDVCAVLLTIQPINPGHMLVVPKEQIDHLWDLDAQTYRHLMDIARQMALRLRKSYTYPRIGLIVEGFGVPHAHIHVFGYTQPLAPTAAKMNEEHYRATPDELKEAADKLRSV